MSQCPTGLKTKVDGGLHRAIDAGDQTRTCTLRLICAAIKDHEIAKRNAEEGVQASLSDDEIRVILSKMVAQREESVRAYEESGRLELAEQEREEAEIIAEFLPTQMSESEKRSAIDSAIRESNAGSLRDIGRVMGLLKRRYPGQMDFTTVGAQVRDRLAT